MIFRNVIISAALAGGFTFGLQAFDGANAVERNSAAMVDSGRAEDAALLKRGRIVFLRCRSCHTLKEGDRHLTGPNLHGLIGAQAAAKEGYAYSDSLTQSGVTWTEESLDAWLTSPSGFVKGNRMVFAGLPKSSDRVALIRYLAEETK